MRSVSSGTAVRLLLIPAIAIVLTVTGCPPMMPDGNGNGNANGGANGNANTNGGANANANGDDGDKNSGLTGKYIGSAVCAQCHNHTHTHWSMTLHSRALEALKEIGQDENPTCLACHTVGFGEPGGFQSEDTTAALAGVGCEACHGPARDHVMNVNEEDLRPPVTLSATLCGQCHTGAHQPNFDEWSESAHAGIEEHVAEGILAGGGQVASCGQCHSGDVFFTIAVEGGAPNPTDFLNKTAEDLTPITCVICHNPHQRTNNAAEPEDGRDFQLRFPEVVVPFPTNTVAATTDPTRFNLCGQCHHSRGRTWVDSTRGPHHSVQSNVYTGEMPMPDTGDEDPDPLVSSRGSPHLLAREQCATCHMYRQDFQSEQAPAIAGHTFQVNYLGCINAGCHNTSAAQIQTRGDLYRANTEERIDDIKTRLGDVSTWGYSAEGGPMDQTTLSDNIKKIRFLISYIESDGSLGIHNPDYVNAMLNEAERLLDVEGL